MKTTQLKPSAIEKVFIAKKQKEVPQVLRIWSFQSCRQWCISSRRVHGEHCLREQKPLQSCRFPQHRNEKLQI